MKHSHIAGLTLIAGLLSGCADNAPYQDTNSKQEEYVRQFIEDFGVPVPGHDFSMATSAGLQVKASKLTSIIVTAEIDGKEYEFANLSVPAGTTPLPVTIPKSVSELNIYLGLAKYTVNANEIVDLDRLAKSPASRSITYNSVPGSDNYFSTSKDGNPVLAIKYSDFLDAYFRANPIGDDNTMSDVADENGKKTSRIGEWVSEELDDLLFCETILWDSKYVHELIEGDVVEYDIFPIYWQSTKDNLKGYKLGFSDFMDYNKVTMTSVNFGGTEDNPFPGLGYSTSVSSVEEIDFSDLSNFTYPTKGSSKAYELNNPDMVIVSEGIRLQVKNNARSRGISMDLLTPTGDGENYRISSSSPLVNKFSWGNNYYSTSLSNLATCRGASKRTFLDKAILEDGVKGGHDRSSEDRFYGPLTVCNPNSTTPEQRRCELFPFLIGFSTPPSSPNDEMKRDYANALFLVVPVTKYEEVPGHWMYYISMGANTLTTFNTFYWTIAVEDLGGSCDWDFNDAVFAFSDKICNLNTENKYSTKTQLWGPSDAVTVRSIEVLPLAAGGTMPLYITFTGNVYKNSLLPLPLPAEDDENTYFELNNQLKYAKEGSEVLDGTWVLGTEIHKWLGQSTYTQQFNTGGKRVNISTEDKIVRLNVPTNLKPGEYWYLNNHPSYLNMTLMGFAVLVDKEDKLQIDTKENGVYSFIEQPNLTLGDNTYLIDAPNSDKNKIAPQMLLIRSASDFNEALNVSGWKDIQWEWPQEFISIDEAYPDFTKWISEDINLDWTVNKDGTKVTKK